MSVIVCSGTNLCKSQVNTSLSKYMYSFSKAQRFPKVQMEELPEEDKEKTRASDNPDTKTPAQQSTNNNEQENQGAFFFKNTPAYSFGIGREQARP